MQQSSRCIASLWHRRLWHRRWRYCRWCRQLIGQVCKRTLVISRSILPVWAGPISVDWTNAGITVARDFCHEASDDLVGHIIRVEKHGQVFRAFTHLTCQFEFDQVSRYLAAADECGERHLGRDDGLSFSRCWLANALLQAMMYRVLCSKSYACPGRLRELAGKPDRSSYLWSPQQQLQRRYCKAAAAAAAAPADACILVQGLSQSRSTYFGLSRSRSSFRPPSFTSPFAPSLCLSSFLSSCLRQ